MNTPTRRPLVVTHRAPFVAVALAIAALIIAGAIALCVALDVPAWTIAGLLAAGVGHLVTLGVFRRRRAGSGGPPDCLPSESPWPRAAVAPDASGDRFARPHTIIPK